MLAFEAVIMSNSEGSGCELLIDFIIAEVCLSAWVFEYKPIFLSKYPLKMRWMAFKIRRAISVHGCVLFVCM
jgi:hypothetical protein